MLTIHHSTIYTNGEPFARFASSLAAANWLDSVGYKLAARVGAVMIFELRNK